MARKRMIAPQIWDSFSFAELSDLAKILFISLISHADDEGRGIAGAAYIKNVTFPHDETRRVAEVQKALSEIALHTSTQFYQVEGRDYYCLLHWTEYQKVDKPSKSKLPPPHSVGEGGGIHFPQPFGESSANIRGVVGESSANKENIREINKNNTHTACARESEDLKELSSLNSKSKEFQTELDEFVKSWNITVDSCSPFITDFDFDKLNAAYANSTKFLQKSPIARSLAWIVKHYTTIVGGRYADFEKEERNDKNKPKYSTSYDPEAIPWEGDGGIHITPAGGDENNDF